MTERGPLRSWPIFREAVSDLRTELSAFIPYEILFKILAIAVFEPVAALIFKLAVEWSGGGTLSNSQIVDFVLSPLGAAATVFAVAAAVGIIMAEYAGLMIIFGHRLAGQRITTIGALLRMLKRLPGLLGLGLFQTVASLAIVLPFGGAIWLIYDRFLAAFDIYYLVQVRPPVFWWCLAPSVLLLTLAGSLLLSLTIRWRFAVPIFLIHGRFLTALTHSRRLTRGSFWLLARLFGLTLGVTIALTLVSELVLVLLENLAVSVAGHQLSAVAIAVGLVTALRIVALSLVTTCFLSLDTIQVSRSFMQLSGWRPTDDDVQATATLERRVPMPRLVWIGLILFLAVSTAGSLGLMDNLGLEDRVEITAHRGSSAKSPENTISAVEQAIRDGADWAEIDVQEAADGALVVIHDTDLLRIAGLDKKIWQTTYEELAPLDVGSWFSPDFAGERIPTLKEMIDAARGRIKLNIELKLHGRERRLVQSVVETIAAEEYGSECILTSLDYASLLRVEELDPTLRTGYILFRTVGDVSRIKTDVLSLESGLATAARTLVAQQAGKEVHVWTVNTSSMMSEMIDRGADNLITDHPEQVVGLLRERAELSDVERLLLRWHARDSW